MADKKKEAAEKTETAEQPEKKQSLGLQRIYIKDLSFETPGAPDIFKKEWKPEVQLDLQTSSSKVDEGVHEVVLALTVTAKSDDKVAFLIEVKHAGIFTIQGFEGDQLHHTLGSFCPSMLYPYAREVVTDVVNRGSFPQLILAPVNFEALYLQHREQEAGKKDGDAANT